MPRGPARARACLPGPMQREPLTLPDAIGRGPCLLTRPDGTGTVHPARCNRPRGTAHPARCDRPRGTAHPARCDRPRVRCPGNRPRAVLASPGPMQREPFTLPDAQGNGPRSTGAIERESFTLPDATGRGSDAEGNRRGPALAHPARWNGNRSPGPMQPAAGNRSPGPMRSAAGPMPWGTGRGPVACSPGPMQREPFTLPDAQGNGLRSTCAIERESFTLPDATGPRSLGAIEREPLTRPDAIGRGSDGAGTGAGRGLLTRPDGMGTVHPARCNRPRGTAHPARCDRPRVRCPGEPAAGLCLLTRPDATGTVHPARCPGEPRACACLPCPMQWEPFTLPDATGRAYLRDRTGTGSPGPMRSAAGPMPREPARAVPCSPGPMQPAAGNRSPGPMRSAAGPMPRGNRPRACACSPGPMQSAAHNPQATHIPIFWHNSGPNSALLSF